MIKYGGYYLSQKGGAHKALNPVTSVNGQKINPVVLFMNLDNGKLYTMPEDDFVKRFKEVGKDEIDI